MPGQAAPDVKVVHFADPWCWWSWGLEPVLQRLREVYGDRLQVEYRMGGMCKDLDAWMKEYAVDEASAVEWIRESVALFKNALDPEYLRKSGVQSTYPACLAFKAAQRQDEHRAEKFFRRMMEAFQIKPHREPRRPCFGSGGRSDSIGLGSRRISTPKKSKGPSRRTAGSWRGRGRTS